MAIACRPIGELALARKHATIGGGFLRLQNIETRGFAA